MNKTRVKKLKKELTLLLKRSPDKSEFRSYKKGYVLGLHKDEKK